MSNVGVVVVATSENGGSFQYTMALIEALVTLPEHRLTLFIDGDMAPFARFGLPMRKLGSAVDGMAGWLRRMAGGTGLFSSVDAVLAPVYSPLLLATARPFAFTLHDVQERHFPGYFSDAQRLWRYLTNTLLTRSATRIICESDFVRADISRFFKVPSERIKVIPAPPLGVFDGPRPDAHTRRAVAERLSLPPEYVLYPAQFWPHKNHRRLFEAFVSVAERHRECHLVLTGERHHGSSAVLAYASALGIRDRVIDLGFVESADLPVVYALARAVVVPTLFESISLPMYEAFSLGVPVCASRVVALPDQAGDAALLFDPRIPADMARAIDTLLTDEQLRHHLVENGHRRMAEHTRPRYAAELDALIAELVPRTPV